MNKITKFQAIIGKKIKIIDSKNPSLLELKGLVLDETKNMLTLESSGGIKKIVKKDCIFAIENQKNIKGSELVGSPADRLKRSRRK